jgi:hypothetical protein
VLDPSRRGTISKAAKAPVAGPVVGIDVVVAVVVGCGGDVVVATASVVWVGTVGMEVSSASLVHAELKSPAIRSTIRTRRTPASFPLRRGRPAAAFSVKIWEHNDAR